MSTRCEILVVDDEPIVGERLKAFIEKDGHKVETFVDPAAALRRLEAKDFDIVISDIRMGEIDGIQVMEKVFAEIATHQGHHDYRLRHTGVGPGIVDQGCL